ncbi:MinD/ParA family protein [Anaeroselena agilis]|uniref:MinD/ParA family protein n=1 Tax=Anaeroselena agilis TaxID=3063788 RepID=A0ABU3NWX7_9FIRM|nr:MinD/ParA family protein [Selenomonadales bacterium 4137-cl]
MRDQAERLRQLARGYQKAAPKSPIIKQSESRARVITVTSGKGGVGKTNLTVNLALALAKLGQKVLIIDADLGLANVEFVLGLTPKYNLLNLLDGGYDINDVVMDGPRGIKFMSGGSGIYQLANLSDAQVQKIIGEVVLFDSWANIILIDTGAGLHRNVLNFVMAADEVIIITTPEPTAIADAYAMIKAYAAHHGCAPLRLVVNRVLEAEEGQTVIDKLGKVAQRFLGVGVTNLGFVFEDPNVLKAVKSQVPVVVAHPETVSARCFDHIAQRLLYGREVNQPSGIKGFFSKFIDLIR